MQENRLVLTMDEDRLREIVEQSVRQAFKEVGLADDDARDDIKDLRSLLKAFRDAQRTILKTALTFLTLGVLGLVSFGAVKRINGGE